MRILSASSGDIAMLNIIFGECPEAIYNTSVYFDNRYQDEWFDDDFAKKIIRSIDKSLVLGPHAIESPVLGVIPPERLAGGTKTLLLMRNEPDTIFNASTCGDNCARFILELARDKTLTINLNHIMRFNRKKFNAHIVNTNIDVFTNWDYIQAAVNLL